MVGTCAAALLALAAPAGATEVSADRLSGSCQVNWVGESILLTGVYIAPAGATSAALVCHVYVNGQLVASFGGSSVGPATVVARVIQNAPPGAISTCAESHHYYLDGSSAHKWC